MFKKVVGSAVALSAALCVGSFAQAQDTGTSTAALPNVIESTVRIAPVFGTSSFTVANEVSTDNFGDSYSAGVLADFGKGTWAFETGILTLQANADSSEGAVAGNIDTWGVPLLAKWNASGNPHKTFFVKAGGMPFVANGPGDNDVNLMAVGGIGGAIPLGRSSAVILDASYNRLFTDNGDLTDYQGIALLAGLSFNL
ncbi:MAG: hypothetical protein EOP05_13675 [Proteobacteria bacterium]|nr:MAG: hypothetical protein EOP05_13675 [Pseudomonadota bacterium]